MSQNGYLSLRYLITATLAAALVIGCADQPDEDSASEPAGGDAAAGETIIDPPVPNNLVSVDQEIQFAVIGSAQAVRLSPDDPEAWASHGRLLLANRFYRSAETAFQKSLDLDGQQPRVLYHLAFVESRLNNLDSAIQRLQTLLEQQPSPFPPAGWRRLAHWHLESGDTEAAEDAARNAARQQAPAAGSVETLAEVLLQQQQPDEALEVLEPLLAAERGYAHHLAAQAYRQLGMTEELQKSLARAQERPEVWPDPWIDELEPLASGRRHKTDRAITILKNSGPRAALPHLQEVVAEDPENVELIAALGFALAETEQLNEAIAVMEPHASASNRSATFWRQYGHLQLEKAKREGFPQSLLVRAENAVFTALELDPLDPDLYIGASAIAMADGRPGDAANILQEGIDHVPQDAKPQLKFRLALLMISDERLTEAEELVTELLADAPQSPDLNRLLQEVRALQAKQSQQTGPQESEGR